MKNVKGEVAAAKLDPLKAKIGAFLDSMKGNKRIDDSQVIKVKGKALTSFLGFVNTKLSKLAIEAFPPELNK